jgi:hypothetical protein
MREAHDPIEGISVAIDAPDEMPELAEFSPRSLPLAVYVIEPNIRSDARITTRASPPIKKGD